MKANLIYPGSNSLVRDTFYCDQVIDVIKPYIIKGFGINLTDFNDPIPAEFPLVTEDLPAEANEDENNNNEDDDPIETDLITNVIREVSEERLAVSLYTNFNGGFGFGSFSAALNQSKILNKKSTSIIISIKREQIYDAIKIKGKVIYV